MIHRRRKVKNNGLLSLSILLLLQQYIVFCDAENALGLTDEEVQVIQHITDLYEDTLSYKHNIHEILKPFLSPAFRASVAGHPQEGVSALLLEPVRLLGDALAFQEWLDRVRVLQPLRPGYEQKIITEVIYLLKMTLDDKFTLEAEKIIDDASQTFIHMLVP